MPEEQLKQPKKTMFLLEADAHESLRQTAFELGISMGEALREAVELWLKQRKPKQKGGQVEKHK